MCKNLKPVEHACFSTLTTLLGVRPMTNNEQCYVEANTAIAKALIKDWQCTYIKKLYQRAGFTDPKFYRIELAKQCRSPAGVYIANLDLAENQSCTWLSNAKNAI